MAVCARVHGVSRPDIHLPGYAHDSQIRVGIILNYRPQLTATATAQAGLVVMFIYSIAFAPPITTAKRERAHVEHMRIRTDNRPERKDVIESAAAEWGCNKTDAIVASCELATWMLRDLEQLLADPRIPPAVAQDIVEDLEGIHLDVETTAPEVSIVPK